MNKILFKAKKLSDGEWVKGSLVKTPFGTFIEWYEDSICNKREVDPSTVYQFTGLKDCEGNEIWEGDIIKSPYTSEENTIEWNDHLCCFNTVDKIQGSRYYLEKVIKELGRHVISNKFDKKK